MTSSLLGGGGADDEEDEAGWIGVSVAADGDGDTEIDCIDC